MHVDDVGADRDVHGQRDAELARPWPRCCSSACGHAPGAGTRQPPGRAQASRAPSAIAPLSSVAVSSAIPNWPGPSASSTSSDVAPAKRDLEVVDDRRRRWWPRPTRTRAHQIDDHGRQSGLEHVRADTPDDRAARAPRLDDRVRRRRGSRRGENARKARRASPSGRATPIGLGEILGPGFALARGQRVGADAGQVELVVRESHSGIIAPRFARRRGVASLRSAGARACGASAPRERSAPLAPEARRS